MRAMRAGLPYKRSRTCRGLRDYSDGIGHMNITTTIVTLSPGTTTLFTSNGSLLVIHANPDDQMTNTSGNSGVRVVCGAIEKK